MRKKDAGDFARLADWVEGRLSEEEAQAVQEQVEVADEETRATVAWLRAFSRASEETVLASPPPEVRERLRVRFEAYAEGRRQPGLLEHLVARLSFDSGLQTALAGVRTAAVHGSPRQLIYSTDVADIALNIQKRSVGKDLDLSGQILPGEDVAPDSFSVQLLRGTEEVGITTTDDLGQFALESIAPGKYEMLLSADRVEIMMSPVELHA